MGGSLCHVGDVCTVIGCCSGVDRDQRDLTVGAARTTKHWEAGGTHDLQITGANRHDQGKRQQQSHHRSDFIYQTRVR